MNIQEIRDLGIDAVRVLLVLLREEANDPISLPLDGIRRAMIRDFLEDLSPDKLNSAIEKLLSHGLIIREEYKGFKTFYYSGTYGGLKVCTQVHIYQSLVPQFARFLAPEIHPSAN